MYGEPAGKTQSQPSRLKRILTAVVFMAIGSCITGVAMGYYWTGQCSQQYNLGQIDGAEQGRKQVQAQEQERIHKLSDGALTTTN
jgi:hypothetical protein